MPNASLTIDGTEVVSKADGVVTLANVNTATIGSNALVVDSNGNTTLSGTANNIGTSTGTFTGTIGSNVDLNFQKINNNYKIQRYFSSISLPNFTWTKLVDVDDAISEYSHSFDFSSSRFIATTHVFGINPGSGLIWWGVEAQNNTPFAETAFWRSASGYGVSFQTVYNSATSIELQMKNNTGYGPFTTQAVTEFWYYDY